GRLAGRGNREEDGVGATAWWDFDLLLDQSGVRETGFSSELSPPKGLSSSRTHGCQASHFRGLLLALALAVVCAGVIPASCVNVTTLLNLPFLASACSFRRRSC